MNPDDLLHPIIVKYLQEAFDRLIAAYLAQNPGKLPSNTTCMELMQWSYRQTLDPTNDIKSVAPFIPQTR